MTHRFIRAFLGLIALPLLSLPNDAVTCREGSFAVKSLDRYGGSPAVKSEASGFFRVDQVAGRWWFVMPEGNGFLSAGINHVD
jgi:hypothetical protein